MKYPPYLEVRDEALDRCTVGRDLGVELFLPVQKLATFWLLLRSDQPGALIPFVAESAAGIFYELVDPGILVRFRVVGFPGKRVRNEYSCPVEEGYQLRV